VQSNRFKLFSQDKKQQIFLDKRSKSKQLLERYVKISMHYGCLDLYEYITKCNKIFQFAQEYQRCM
jgi:hypothetical protein